MATNGKPIEGEVVDAAIVRVEPTPTSILAAAVQQGASVDTLTKLLELQERYEAGQARKAFVKAMTAFKSNPPKIEKTQQVAYKDVRYKFAPLDEITAIVGPALANHGLSYRWETKQVESRISVTCILQHEQGHSESVTLEASPDTSGSKNSIQAIGSTVSYLQRYTLLSITGLASANQDTDGLTMGNATDFIANMEAASTLHELESRYKEAIVEALRVKDSKAVEAFMQARKRFEAKLRAA